MGEPFIGEIRIFSYAFPPKGWAFCNGASLGINMPQYQLLYSVIGTTYGGDGSTYFQLPDLNGRVPMHWGDFYGDYYRLGLKSGSSFVKLTENQIPKHSHKLVATSNLANKKLGSDSSMLATTKAYAGTKLNSYAKIDSNSTKLKTSNRSMEAVGKGQTHDNRQPSLALNFCIALSGIYPSISS